MPAPIVIVGAGQAAASFVSRYVTLGGGQPLLLIGEESHPPYQRPPLSKKYLLGELERERLFIRPLEWYAEQNVDLRLDTRVDAIDREQRQLVTGDGDRVEYDKLLLATGSRARQLAEDIGGALEGVFTLRSIADIDRMAPAFQAGRKLLIVGGGYIGLEAAARILQRVAAAETSDYFRQLHQGHGVRLLESARLSRLLGEHGEVIGAELESGEVIDTDLVLVGIGGKPDIELAQAAGLDCDNGIRVTDTCHCSCFTRNGQAIRLESVQNASDQGDLVARRLAGEDVRYTALPWFWSDQYDCKLQIVGLNQGHDRTVVRPGASDSSLSIWYYRDDQLLAIDAMNEPKSYAFGRKIIEAGINPTPQQVADPATDLKAIALGR
jgi:3-phenylpropionate/trans-cinnamate dioxygenase ferredoxin reductase subunit